MKDSLIVLSMVTALLLNLFLCFWVGDMFITSGKWFVVPGVATLFVWFVAVAICFGVIVDKKLGD